MPTRLDPRMRGSGWASPGRMDRERDVAADMSPALIVVAPEGDRKDEVVDDKGAGAGGRAAMAVLPEHATDGWELTGPPGKPRLVKDFGAVRTRIRVTAPATCSWWVGRPDGRLLREASVRSIEEAKAAAEAWVAAYLAARSEPADE